MFKEHNFTNSLLQSLKLAVHLTPVFFCRCRESWLFLAFNRLQHFICWMHGRQFRRLLTSLTLLWPCINHTLFVRHMNREPCFNLQSYFSFFLNLYGLMYVLEGRWNCRCRRDASAALWNALRGFYWWWHWRLRIWITHFSTIGLHTL